LILKLTLVGRLKGIRHLSVAMDEARDSAVLANEFCQRFIQLGTNPANLLEATTHLLQPLFHLLRSNWSRCARCRIALFFIFLLLAKARFHVASTQIIYFGKKPGASAM